jgi:hypothetical protein
LSSVSKINFDPKNVLFMLFIWIFQLRIMVMVFSATFNTISANSWQSVLLVEVNRSIRRKPPTCHKSLPNFITKYCFEYTSPSTGFELTTLVVMGTNCVCSCNFNYHMIKNTTSPYYIKHNYLIKWKTKNTTPLA